MCKQHFIPIYDVPVAMSIIIVPYIVSMENVQAGMSDCQSSYCICPIYINNQSSLLYRV